MTDKPAQPSHVLVVDDDPIVRTAIADTLRTGGYRVSEAHSGETAVALSASLRPDVVTMDILMPPGMSGIDATRRILEVHPEARVVMFSVHNAEGVVAAAVAAGATSYLTKTVGLPALLDAVGRAISGQAVLIPAPKHSARVLTNRDRQVMELAVKGLRSREIADQLFLSPRTVENHLANIYAKLGVRSRMELANKVVGGEITPDGITATRPPDSPPPAQGKTQPGSLDAFLPQLSASEQSVAALVAEGMTNREIAEALFISRHTVDSHLRRIFQKLNVRRRVELVDLVTEAVADRGGGVRGSGDRKEPR